MHVESELFTASSTPLHTRVRATRGDILTMWVVAHDVLAVRRLAGHVPTVVLAHMLRHWPGAVRQIASGRRGSCCCAPPEWSVAEAPGVVVAQNRFVCCWKLVIGERLNVGAGRRKQTAKQTATRQKRKSRRDNLESTDKNTHTHTRTQQAWRLCLQA